MAGLGFLVFAMFVLTRMNVRAVMVHRNLRTKEIPLLLFSLTIEDTPIVCASLVTLQYTKKNM